ncbi:hypothetical protein BGAL_0122g00050 [Botrytis galanthina]|uniref:Uncharacterized protein n=1 Tax=Botrytis galanthina TaxID=278940 RepID=A0A4S8R186_9HELO|nr:hypothetical protein BGAL_0122g00050 [Botrytis galanthina]
MCQRQWVQFWCGDLRYAEIRCDQNPADRIFESCATRQTTEGLRNARGPTGHYDPDIYYCPGRCIDWGRIPGEMFENAKDMIFDKLTWIPCYVEWHDTNSGHLSNFAPDFCPETASIQELYIIAERPQKKLKDIIVKTSDIVDGDSSPRP